MQISMLAKLDPPRKRIGCKSCCWFLVSYPYHSWFQGILLTLLENSLVVLALVLEFLVRLDPTPLVIPRHLPFVIPRYTPAPYGGEPGCDSLAAGVLGPDPTVFVIPRCPPVPFWGHSKLKALLLGFLGRTPHYKWLPGVLTQRRWRDRLGERSSPRPPSRIVQARSNLDKRGRYTRKAQNRKEIRKKI